MKTKDKLMLMFSVLFLIFVILIFVNAVKIEDETKLETTRIEHQERTSITFILGEDVDSKNTYYSNAESYFKLNPYDRTDEVRTDVRSLNEMISTLGQSTKPYNEIHIVVHSNPWAGISLPINRDGERINTELLKSAMSSGEVKSLDQEIVDSLTTIHMHACGLGNNRELVSTLSRVLNNASIASSNAYVNFKSKNGQFHKSDMQVYYAFYPTAYKPADLHLARQLAKRYPEVDQNWMLAMNEFSYKYNIPVEWEIKYAEHEVPALENDLEKMEWLMNQDDLLEIIDKTGIPFDYFRWIIKRKDNSVKVYGKVTVLCVLEEIKV